MHVLMIRSELAVISKEFYARQRIEPNVAMVEKKVSNYVLPIVILYSGLFSRGKFSQIELFPAFQEEYFSRIITDCKEHPIDK